MMIITHYILPAHVMEVNPFVHKSLQNYNDFVWTVTQLNRYMNYSLAVVGLLIRKPGPHNSRGSVGPVEVMTSKWFCFEEAFIYAFITYFIYFFFNKSGINYRRSWLG